MAYNRSLVPLINTASVSCVAPMARSSKDRLRGFTPPSGQNLGYAIGNTINLKTFGILVGQYLFNVASSLHSIRQCKAFD